jgi:hypothetical protein
MSTCECPNCKEAAELLRQCVPLIKMVVALFGDNQVDPKAEVELLRKATIHIAKFGGAQ